MHQSDWTIDITSTLRDGYSIIVEATVEGVDFTVTLDDGRLTEFGQATADDVISESFRFLLERGSVWSILPRFDLSVIERHFPEYPQEIRRRLNGR